MSKTVGKSSPQTGKWESKEFRASQGRKNHSAVTPAPEKGMEQADQDVYKRQAPDCMKEYEGETPLKEMAVVEALARWPEEVVAIGVRHTTVLDRYAAAIREYLPERPLFVVTGSTVTFAKRRALRDVLRDSQNGILLCTQQSLPSSVNFEFVNKIIIPEMHYNNAGMSQFYMRFVRYTSTEKKDLYFPIYIGSLESNLMQMVLAKDKIFCLKCKPHTVYI